MTLHLKKTNSVNALNFHGIKWIKIRIKIKFFVKMGSFLRRNFVYRFVFKVKRICFFPFFFDQIVLFFTQSILNGDHPLYFSSSLLISSIAEVVNRCQINVGIALVPFFPLFSTKHTLDKTRAV
jgi:hypothetical protein